MSYENQDYEYILHKTIRKWQWGKLLKYIRDNFSSRDPEYLSVFAFCRFYGLGGLKKDETTAVLEAEESQCQHLSQVVLAHAAYEGLGCVPQNREVAIDICEWLIEERFIPGAHTLAWIYAREGDTREAKRIAGRCGSYVPSQHLLGEIMWNQSISSSNRKISLKNYFLDCADKGFVPSMVYVQWYCLRHDPSKLVRYISYTQNHQEDAFLSSNTTFFTNAYEIYCQPEINDVRQSFRSLKIAAKLGSEEAMIKFVTDYATEISAIKRRRYIKIMGIEDEEVIISSDEEEISPY